MNAPPPPQAKASEALAAANTPCPERVLAILADLRRCRAALDALELPLPAAHVDMAVQRLKHRFGLAAGPAASTL